MGAGRPVVRVRWAVGQGVICFPSAPGAEGWGWRREGGKESGTGQWLSQEVMFCGEERRGFVCEMNMFGC